MAIAARRRIGALTVNAVVAISTAPPAFACPVCHSDLGEQVRAAIFGPSFASNLIAILSPFAIVAVLVCVLAATFSSRAEPEHR
jgi:hypothetical protein